MVVSTRPVRTSHHPAPAAATTDEGLAAKGWGGQDGDACRLFHGRGHCFPGLEHLNIDFFSPIVFITFYKPLENNGLKSFINHLWEIGKTQGLQAIIIQYRYQPEQKMACLRGEMPNKLLARETA